jgi:hypothetical protein
MHTVHTENVYRKSGEEIPEADTEVNIGMVVGVQGIAPQVLTIR